MAASRVDQAPSPWAAHRGRAEVLRERYPFAAEMLVVYGALLDVWEDGWRLAREDPPAPRQLAAWAAERVLPQVVKVTEAAGPEPLAEAAGQLFAAARLEDCLATWLAGGELAPVERYLARAALHSPLVALGSDAAAACADDPTPRDERHCPRCGGPPQLSYRGDGQDRLVSGRRYLACARCGHSWRYSGSACPYCGETSAARRTVYAERRAGPVVGRDADGREADGEEADGEEADGREATRGDAPTFPHLRIDACTSCARYLIDVDMGRDPLAVPEVDELAAVPLDLYAAERGVSKITPNLMGL
jgi:RNA polymerase subunit RPABC4/transcription elongation factor Spt4